MRTKTVWRSGRPDGVKLKIRLGETVAVLSGGKQDF
jgi:hypothetical protein